jgi:hypothetical protein
MTKRRLTESEQLDRLADTLVQDILELSDEEVIAEAKERFGDPKQEIDRLRGVIDGAFMRASKTKLAEAKASLAAYKKNNHSNNVVALSTAQKRTLIERFTAQDSELQQKLTLAARKGEGIQTENDIEGMFEDLIELGLIDEEGNPR